MIPVAIWAALIGAAVAGMGSFISYAVMSAKHEQRLDGHDEKFKGVDAIFSSLDQRFIPRNEMNAQLENLRASTLRIEGQLNGLTAISLAHHRKTEQ